MLIVTHYSLKLLGLGRVKAFGTGISFKDL